MWIGEAKQVIGRICGRRINIQRNMELTDALAHTHTHATIIITTTTTTTTTNEGPFGVKLCSVCQI